MMTGVRRDGDLTLVGDNRVILGCREKPRRDGASRPYPKPTQVVGQSMPRRTSESWLRNSAKCPRNFGRRGALSGDDIYCLSWVGPQRPVRSDCLLKTQVRAKS